MRNKRESPWTPIGLWRKPFRCANILISEGAHLNYVDQEIVLDTEGGFGAEVPLAISSALLRRLEETARPCVRMAIEGASASAGAVPSWLERASDIRTLGFSERNGLSVLHLKAPTLGEAVPEVFNQQTLWPGMASAEDTAIQVIGKIGSVVCRRETASDMYDQSLLKRFAHWRPLFKRDLKQLSLPAAPDSVGSLSPATLDINVVENARTLSAQMPPPRQIRVVGKLDMVRHSTRSFGLVLGGGEEVRGVLLEGDSDLLQKHFGCDITVFGRAIYRPSGSLLRIDAMEISDTTEGRAAFSKIPEALSRNPRPEKRVQTVRGGVGGFFDTWPGDETDEELLAALGELRN
jgi:hypothetical protein